MANYDHRGYRAWCVGLIWMLFDCLMIVGWTLFIYTHAQKHISVSILFRHAHKPNFIPQLKCSSLRNKNWQSDRSYVYGTVSSDTPMRGIEVRFCLPLNLLGKFRRRQKISLSSNFPSSSMQGKIRRQRNLLFSTKFAGEILKTKAYA